MNAQHTPTPWTQGHARFKHWVNVPGLAKGINAGSAANAAFIVRACNSHDALVSALMRIADSFERPGHIAYMSKQEIADVARAALAAAGEGATPRDTDSQGRDVVGTRWEHGDGT